MNIDDYLFANFKPTNDTDLFCQNKLLTDLIKLFSNGMDLSILLHGPNGIGKKTVIIQLLRHLIGVNMTFKKFEPMKTTASSNDYNGLYRYDCVYYLNCKYLSNTELVNLIDKLVPVFKSKSVFDGRKIFIMTNLDSVSVSNQFKISNVIERYSTNVSFIFTSSSNNKIISKIKSLVCKLNYVPLTNKEFSTKFYSIFKHFFNDDEDIMNNKKMILNKFYTIYQNNKYNLGNTLHQINYLYLSEKINKKELNKKINTMSALDKMVVNLINTAIKLNDIKSYEILKTKLYKLKSLTIDDNLIIKSILKNILSIEKMDNDMKQKIIALGVEISENFHNTSKSIILLENFAIKLWAILKNIKYD